jgi:hypothetical protein
VKEGNYYIIKVKIALQHRYKRIKPMKNSTFNYSININFYANVL